MLREKSSEFGVCSSKKHRQYITVNSERFSFESIQKIRALSLLQVRVSHIAIIFLNMAFPVLVRLFIFSFCAEIIAQNLFEIKKQVEKGTVLYKAKNTLYFYSLTPFNFCKELLLGSSKCEKWSLVFLYQMIFMCPQ